MYKNIAGSGRQEGVKQYSTMDKPILPLQANTGKLLFDEHPIMVLPSLAVAIGDREAIFLQQVHYWLVKNQVAKKNFRAGRYWTYNTFEQWQEQLPWLSVRTIKRIVGKLKENELLMTAHYNKKGYDRTTWYSINYENMPNCHPAKCQNGTMEDDTLSPPIPETIPETKEREPDNPPAPPPVTPKNEKPKTPTNGLIGYYIGLYRDRFGHEYPVTKGTDHGIIKNLVTEHGAEMVREILKQHVNTQDKWILDRGCSLKTIQNSLPEYLTRINKVKAEEEAEARRRERDRQQQEQWKREEEEKARERAEYEALPEVDKIRRKLDNDVMMLEVVKKGRGDDAQFGDVAAIDYLLKYIRRVKDRLEELKAAGGEEADQLLKEILEEEKRLEHFKINEEVPF